MAKQSITEQINGVTLAYGALKKLPKKDRIGRESEHDYVLQSLLSAIKSLAFLKGK